MIDLGKKLATLRNQKGISQTILADYLHVTNQTVSKWESNLSLPDINTLIEIAIFYNISLDALMEIENYTEYERLVYAFSLTKTVDNFTQAQKACNTAIRLKDDEHAKGNLLYLYQLASQECLQKQKEIFDSISLDTLNEFQVKQRLIAKLTLDFHSFKNHENLKHYKKEYSNCKTSTNALGYIICLSLFGEYEAVLTVCDDYLNAEFDEMIYLKKIETLISLNKLNKAIDNLKVLEKKSKNTIILYNCYYHLYTLTRHEDYKDKLKSLARHEEMSKAIDNLG